MDNRTYISGPDRRLRRRQSGGRRRRQFPNYVRSGSRTTGDVHDHGDGRPTACRRAFVYTVNQANAKTSTGTGRQVHESRMLGVAQGRVLLMTARAQRRVHDDRAHDRARDRGAAAGARDSELLGLDRRRPDPQRRRVDRERNALCAEPGRHPQQRRRVHPYRRAPGWTARARDRCVDTCKVASSPRARPRPRRPPLPAAATTVTFSSLGGIVANADASATLTEVRCHLRDGRCRRAQSQRPGRWRVARKTGIKICDPKWPATDPKGCPA